MSLQDTYHNQQADGGGAEGEVFDPTVTNCSLEKHAVQIHRHAHVVAAPYHAVQLEGEERRRDQQFFCRIEKVFVLRMDHLKRFVIFDQEISRLNNFRVTESFFTPSVCNLQAYERLRRSGLAGGQCGK